MHSVIYLGPSRVQKSLLQHKMRAQRRHHLSLHEEVSAGSEPRGASAQMQGARIARAAAVKSPESSAASLVFLSWAPAGASLCGQVLADPHPPAIVHASSQRGQYVHNAETP